MIAFVVNVLLALAWVVMTGQPGIASFLVGFALGFTALFLSSGLWNGSIYFRRLKSALMLAGWCLVELCGSAFSELAATFKSKTTLYCAEIPVTVTTDAELALLSLLISFSPRTLAIGPTADRRRLIVWTRPNGQSLLETRVAHLLEPQVREVLR